MNHHIISHKEHVTCPTCKNKTFTTYLCSLGNNNYHTYCPSCSTNSTYYSNCPACAVQEKKRANERAVQEKKRAKENEEMDDTFCKFKIFLSLSLFILPIICIILSSLYTTLFEYSTTNVM